MKRLLLSLLFLSLLVVPHCDAQKRADSDSIIRDLQTQLRDMKLNEVMLREQLDRDGRAIRTDSMRQVRLKLRIDSLRSITPGASVIVGNDVVMSVTDENGVEIMSPHIYAHRSNLELQIPKEQQEKA